MGVVAAGGRQAARPANFVRDLLRLKAEIIGQNFDAATLEAMTGEEVTPEVLDILRSDFQRTCTIDIEADSTVIVDEQGEQQAMAQIMQSMQAVMQGAGALLQTGMLPPPQVMQLPRNAEDVAAPGALLKAASSQLIDDFQEQLAMLPMAC